MRSYLITFKSENKNQIIKHIASFPGYAKNQRRCVDYTNQHETQRIKR